MTGDWTFFSNHGHVLVCLARNSGARLRDVAQSVGITERAVQKIVRDLQQAGYLTITKRGRCNRYRINRRKGLRHPLESRCSVSKLLALVAKAQPQEVTAAVSMNKAQARPEPPAEGAKTGSERKAGPEPAAAKNKAEKKQEDSPERGPIDVRQQGSLF